MTPVSTAQAITKLGALNGRAFIDGDYTAAVSGRTFATINPATGAILTDIARTDHQDVATAVGAARQAFDSGVWASSAHRKRVLLSLADLIERHAEELALLDCVEAGKPITDCRDIDVPETVATFRWYAESIDKMYDAMSPGFPETFALIVREPVGVVAAVLPWNFPLIMLAWKVAPALAAGNCVVVKPAEQTSLSALRLAGLAAEAGIPPGVFSVLPGYGEEAGSALAMHAGVDVASFTGSSEVGRQFLRYSADSNLKKIILECGGKSPQIVLQDAPDMDFVAGEVLSAAFWNMGENCTCGSRLLVQNSVKDALLEAIDRKRGQWIVGDPLDAATMIGPLVDQAQLTRVLAYVNAGHAQGARTRFGGTRTLEGTGGYYMEPTMFEDVLPHMTISREEIFGPVVAVTTFEIIDEALILANDSDYGLAASIYTTNIDNARTLGSGIKAGTVSVNCYSEGDVTTPFGGYKLSGFGGRDKSLHAFDQYTELKTLWFGRVP